MKCTDINIDMTYKDFLFLSDFNLLKTSVI